MGRNYLSIPKLQLWSRWGLGTDKSFHPILYSVFHCLFMLGLKLIYVTKRDPADPYVCSVVLQLCIASNDPLLCRNKRHGPIEGYTGIGDLHSYFNGARTCTISISQKMQHVPKQNLPKAQIVHSNKNAQHPRYSLFCSKFTNATDRRQWTCLFWHNKAFFLFKSQFDLLAYICGTGVRFKTHQLALMYNNQLQ